VLIFSATPNIINARLGPVDESICDTSGIDNNPVGQFRLILYGANTMGIGF